MIRLSLFVMLMVAVSTTGQATDTIYVNHDQHAYLVFDEEISLLDLWGRERVRSRHSRKCSTSQRLCGPCRKKRGVPDGSFRYCYRDQHFRTSGKQSLRGSGVLPNVAPEITLRSAGEKTMNKAASYDRRNYVPEVDISLVEERLYQLDEEKRQIHDIGVSKNKVDWSLTNLRVDNSAIYLKLRLENQSALVYRIESISVENAEFYRKRLLSKKKVNKVPVEPLVEGSIVDVRPYDQHDYYVAIPVYAVGDQGAVMVTIRETSGIRSLQLEIPPQLMANADLFLIWIALSK